jgi:hypothetical protein
MKNHGCGRGACNHAATIEPQLPATMPQPACNHAATIAQPRPATMQPSPYRGGAMVAALARIPSHPLAPEDDDDKRDHAEDLIYFAKLYGWSFEQMVADDFKAVIGIAAMNSGGMN